MELKAILTSPLQNKHSNIFGRIMGILDQSSNKHFNTEAPPVRGIVYQGSQPC
jgi:hypothetical protein